jgi:hypothetical protein
MCTTATHTETSVLGFFLVNLVFFSLFLVTEESLSLIGLLFFGFLGCGLVNDVSKQYQHKREVTSLPLLGFWSDSRH